LNILVLIDAITLVAYECPAYECDSWIRRWLEMLAEDTVERRAVLVEGSIALQEGVAGDTVGGLGILLLINRNAFDAMQYPVEL
jgi:hypothetical protein